MIICTPKLLKFISTEKYGYRNASIWLNKNTLSTDIIAVPDKRLAFYAQRPWLEYSEDIGIPKEIHFIVKISNPKNLDLSDNDKERYVTWVDKKKKRKIMIISRN